MNHDAKKISKLVDELLTYFLYHYNCLAEIIVTPGPDAYRLRMHFSGLVLDDDALAALRQRLQVRRQPELEDYYWQLAGELDDSNELMLLGMMCDRIELRRAGPDAITIELLRRVE